MDTIFALASAAGLAGSVALIGWGMVLSLAHGLDFGGSRGERTRPLDRRLPAGTLS